MADGTVIIIGGAEDKVRDRVILSRFVALAGGADATIAVISTASSLGPEAGERYRRVFGELGVKRVRPLHAVTRAAGQRRDRGAGRPRRDRHLPDRRQPAAAVVDDRRHALADAILDRHRTARWSPARAPAPRRCPATWSRSARRGATPKQRMAQMAAGLGLLPGRHRRPALPAAEPARPAARLIAQNPSLLGLGVDEDTAGVVGPDHVMEVIGRGTSPSSTAPSPRPTPGRSTATGR